MPCFQIWQPLRLSQYHHQLLQQEQSASQEV